MITVLVGSIGFLAGYLIYHFFGPTLDKYIIQELARGSTVMIVVNNKAVRYKYQNNTLTRETLFVATDELGDYSENN